MNNTFKSKWLALALCGALALAPFRAIAEDIDIFVGTSAGSAGNPNVLFVLDNTSNWARQSQQWPGGIQQGQSEVRAIKNAIADLDDTINIGMKEYVTEGTANDDGGFIGFAVKPMSAANKSAFGTILDRIFNNINDPHEKRNANTPYGNLMFDVYNYFTGSNTYSPTGTVYAAHADTTGYTTSYSKFKAPAIDACNKNFIIFIGNPNSSGPATDSAANTAKLAELGGDTTTIPWANYTTTTTVNPGACTLIRSTTSCANNCSPSAADIAACPSPKEAKCSAITPNTCSPASKSKYDIQCCDPDSEIVTITPTGTYSTPTSVVNADEWARFLYQTDLNSTTANQQNVITYTIDVYNKQPNAEHTALLRSMATVGGGKYFAAKDEAAILAAIKEILAEIQSVNTTFASASLPVNATNRAQNENQVFIGMFRPDPQAKPRWFGNMKRYQLINSAGAIELGDEAGNLAVNTLTGFLTDCATSYWTTDSGTYWQSVPINPTPAGRCTTSGYNKFSDAPDGPTVEKGGVAEVIRKGNNPPTTNDTPDWVKRRNLYWLLGGGLSPFNYPCVSAPGAGISLYFWGGCDDNDENANASLVETRPSLHGDVIHSRPLPVNYGGSTGVTVYYGANDGWLRAVEAATGKELWAFYGSDNSGDAYTNRMRLKDNSPLISFPHVDMSIVPTPKPKNYYFDGSIGVYQTFNSDSTSNTVWIYPTMRRGGRMVYALDVGNPASFSYKWRAGCPNLTDDAGCTASLSGIGQTWSMPSAAFIKGYSDTAPVVVMGGGYDACEDANTSAPACGSAKGRGIYILDANTGALIKSFSTTRSVAADVSMIDIDYDGKVDYAYAADTGGNIYRIDFISDPSSKTALASTSWTINRVAYTNGAGRKFLYPPSLLPSGSKVYLAIGSGDREHPLETQYPYAGVVNRFYVYVDDLAASSANDLDSTTTMSNFTVETTCGTERILPDSTVKGWFMDLNQYGQGEQTVTSAVIIGGMVTFSTNRPVPAASGACSTSLGEARGYWVNLFNASGAIGTTNSCGGTSRSGTFTGGGLPPSPVLGVVPIGGKPTTVVIGAVQRTGGASSPISPQQVKPSISSKRKVIYWKSSGDN